MSLRGQLLVASPWLGDKNFVRTVVLVLENGDEGSLGVVLNRPSETSVREALPMWVGPAAEPSMVYVGGPVAETAALGLARVGEGYVGGQGTGGWQPLWDRYATLDLTKAPAELEVPIEQMRVFAGHAGWIPGQLEGEIRAGGWFVVDADPGDALTPRPATLWRDVLQRQPRPLRAVANFPLDLSLN